MGQPLAYLYPEFLESADARPIRILAEYLEPLRRSRDKREMTRRVCRREEQQAPTIGRDARESSSEVFLEPGGQPGVIGAET